MREDLPVVDVVRDGVMPDDERDDPDAEVKITDCDTVSFSATSYTSVRFSPIGEA